MCTANSLAWIPKSRFFQISQGVVLGILLLCSSGLTARDGSSAPFITTPVAITITAPPDMTVSIKTPGSCDSLINLPAAAINSTCLPVQSSNTLTVFGNLNSNGGLIRFQTGVYQVIYQITDNCRVVAIDTMKITVFDATPPNVICTPEMVINLNSTGQGLVPAVSLDGGSTDDCGHVYFKLKRMNAPIGFSCTLGRNPNYRFDDEILFCCMDIGSSPIPVILRVYDVYPGAGPVPDSLYLGHFRDCMVMVSVADKIGPNLLCPANLTVSCGFDTDSLFSKQRPIYSDNCSSVRLDSQIIRNLNGCGSGTVQRKYTATDRLGLKSECSQTVTLLKNSNFNGLDTNQLKWPAHTIVYACRIKPDTIKAGVPIIKEDKCDQVLVKKTDELYDFTRGGVCGKVLRTWEVINWCVYNPYLTPNPRIADNGYYSYVQEIKVMDTIPPEIIGFNDTLIYSFAENCGSSLVQLPDVSASDCGVTSAISISYEIDFGSEGKIDRSGVGPNASGIMPMGPHSIYFKAVDSCHNETVKLVRVEVKDGKKPSVLLLHGISTSLLRMPAGTMVSVPASLLNKKSEDNCTKTERLRFSYSSDPNDTIRTYTCDDIGQNIVSVYVWDECNNSSYATTYIAVTDPDSLCPQTFNNYHVSGLVRSYYGMNIPEVRVRLQYGNTTAESITDEQGQYSFLDIPKGISAGMEGYCDLNFLDGISTADILRIQQHILGINPISNPYDLLAADVDQSGSITAKDLSVLRNLILGRITALPNNASYLCIDKSYRFSYPAFPWEEYKQHKLMNIPALESNKKIDFIGIKLGDLNQSLFQKKGVSNESDSKIINYQFVGSKLILSSDSECFINGLQLSIRLEKNCSENISLGDNFLKDNWSDDFIRISENEILISINLMRPIVIKKGEVLFEFNIPGLKIICPENLNLTENFNHEMYGANDKSYSINLKKTNNTNSGKDLEILEAGPNPTQGNYLIKISNGKFENLDLECFDVSGKSIFQQAIFLVNGVNTVELDQRVLTHSGVYFLVLRTAQSREVLKIVVQ
ncbi:MAG: T9SS type A sorting domain-containing protein [Saprospiraceae bacterium]